MERLLKSNDKIMAVSAVSASLKKNERKTILFKTQLPELQKAWDEYLGRRVPNVPVFSMDRENDRVTNLINGAFDCRPFKQTVGYSLYPEVDKYAPWLCSTAIPSGIDRSGDFVGFLNIFLSTEPTDIERKQLAKDAIILSTLIYRREVAQTPSK